MGLKGREAFEAYYSELFGEDWPGLRRSLEGAKVKVPLLVSPDKAQYELDPASYFVGSLVQAKAGDHILDMCAAPGGKSLCILKGNQAIHLTANDLSKSRVARLKRVFQEHLSEEQLKNVEVWSGDANRYGLRAKSQFDWVLLDAPCSGERHLLESKKDLDQWSLGRSKSLGKRQYSLLCAGMLALKSGGRLVYSTCSMSPYENDEVIGRYLQKKSDHGRLVDLPQKGLPTQFGRQFRPDLHDGWGPMFFTILERTN